MTASVRRSRAAVAAALAPAVLLSVVSLACSTPLLKLPKGPGMPARDGAAVIDQATAACRAISTVTLEIAVRGSVGGQRMRGRLSAGLAKPASARLEAVASFGPPAFFFVATNTEATLLIPRDQRVARGRPEALLEAVAGVPLDPPALRSVVTGCAGMPDAVVQAIGDDWRVTRDGNDEIYLRREQATGSWRLVATLHPSTPLRAGPGGAAGWRAEYADFDRGLPRAIRLVSTPAGRFDLQLELSQVDINMPLGAEVFRIEIPASAQTITVDELMRSGPLGGK